MRKKIKETKFTFYDLNNNPLGHLQYSQPNLWLHTMKEWYATIV